MTTNGNIGSVSATNGHSPNGAASIELNLRITDRDLCEELAGHSEGQERNDFAIDAMRIGVLALRQAQGRVDADRVRQEGDRLIENMGHALGNHQQSVIEQVGNSLKTYFDPNSGQFNERVQRLVGQDGELERVIRKQIDATNSDLAKTLADNVGNNSPLMQILNPDSASGLIVRLSQSTEATLTAQRERILSEFSKDNQDSAINRLIVELTSNHGEVGKSLEARIDKMSGEFSSDNPDSALSRMMGQVKEAQSRIRSEFDLNQDTSALARMRKEFLEAIEKQNQTNTDFQTEVKTTLAAMVARKEESERGTRHGLEFEKAVFQFASERCQIAGDFAVPTGNSTGLIRNSRKGDVVIELGTEAVAAGAKIVIEAKQDTSYGLQKALAELEDARKNRGAGIGVFVFSKRTAPNGLEAFNRYGNDIVVVWDAEDPASDVFLLAGLSVAKALCTCANDRAEETGADFEAIDKAIFDIEKQVEGLNEIDTAADAIEKQTVKITNRTRIMRNNLTRQISVLNEKVGGLREAVGSDS